MSRITRKKEKTVQEGNIFKQVLSTDYWEGYYALTNGDIVKCEDTGEDSARYTAFSLKSGKKYLEGEFKFGEETLFSGLVATIEKDTGSKLYLRISDSCQNPDRHEEIESVFEHPDSFELLRIKNLVKHLKNRGINIFGGRVGGLELSEGGCNGFYILENGNMLYCRDMNNWEDDKVDRIIDGVISYHILEPSRFSISASTEHYYGYLSGEKFSLMMEELSSKKVGTVSSIIALEGDELFQILCKAAEGDPESAAIASHRLKINLCVHF